MFFFGDINTVLPRILFCSIFVTFLSLELANKIEFAFVGLKNYVRTVAVDVFDAFDMTLVFAIWFIRILQLILIFFSVFLWFFLSKIPTIAPNVEIACRAKTQREIFATNKLFESIFFFNIVHRYLGWDQGMLFISNSKLAFVISAPG